MCVYMYNTYIYIYVSTHLYISIDYRYIYVYISNIHMYSWMNSGDWSGRCHPASRAQSNWPGVVACARSALLCPSFEPRSFHMCSVDTI